MSKKKVLFISGISDKKKVTIIQIDRNGIPIVANNGNVDLFSYLETDQFEKTKIMLDTSPNQKIIIEDEVDAIFNQITECDTHTISLTKLQQIYKAYAQKIPFFNLPSKIFQTSREKSYQHLNKLEKVNFPKTVKLIPLSALDIYNTIIRENLVFPVILRLAGEHGGKNMKFITDKNETFYAYPLDGRAYYLTQFVNYCQNDLYTKYRFIVVNGEVFIRHVIISDKWNIQGDAGRAFMIENSQYRKKEADIMKNFEKTIKPHIQQTVKKIYDIIGLDYFGIDCSLDEYFNMLIFEINASVYLINKDREEGEAHREAVENIQKALITMINSKL